MKRKFMNCGDKNRREFCKTANSGLNFYDRDWFDERWTDVYYLQKNWFDKNWVQRYRFSKN